MQIRTNHQSRPVLYGFELTDTEKQNFDYLENLDDSTFFRFKGQVYNLGEFVRIKPPIAPHTQREGFENWHGYASDSYFSGILVKYVDNYERVIVAQYFS